jgi:hypothetical protein
MQNRIPARTAQAAIGTAALALLATTATASTEVDIIGHAQIEGVEYRDTRPDPTVDDYVLTDGFSGRLGIEAREDLGFGRALFARYLFRSNTASGRLEQNNPGREALVGIEGGFGTITGGHLPSPYRYTGGVSYDAFADTSLEASSNGAMTGNEGPLLSSDRADSAHHAGIRRALGYRARGERVEFRAAASYDSDDRGLDDYAMHEDRMDDGEQGDFAASVKTFGADWELFAATAVQRRATVVRDSNESLRRLRTHKIGGRYIGGNHTWSVQAESFRSEERATDAGMAAIYKGDQEGSAGFIGYQFDFQPNVFVVQLGGQTMEYHNGDTAGALYYALGFVHRLTEQGQLFTGYRRSRFEDDAEGDYRQRAFSIGLSYSF